MKMNNSLPVALVFTASFIFSNAQAWSQEEANRLAQLEALLTAQNWVEADRETIALIRNNPQNLSCSNLRAMNQLWVQNSRGKYGFTPQMEIWKNAGGLNCKTCEGEIRKFSEQVGWVLGDQINPLPGDFPGQYPTVAALGWERYVDSSSNVLTGLAIGWSNPRVWQAWRVRGFNLFSEINKCGL